MRKLVLLAIFCWVSFSAFAQKGADTLHYNKVYYFGGTGIALPLGKTKQALSTKLFTGSMGLDISLKNPKYYLQPTLYLMNFKYDQLFADSKYNRVVENARASMYVLSLAGGIRRQWNRLNTYAYIGPAGALNIEPRAQDAGNNELVELHYKYSISPAAKIGIGADYKFKGFFLGTELGYMHNFREIQGNPVNVMTLMVGLKSDITSLKNEVVDVIQKTTN